MNEYRIGYINTLLAEKKIMKKTFKEFLGLQNDTTIREICEGKDISVSRLVLIADFLGVPVAEFFLFNGQPEQAVSNGSGESFTQYLVRQIVDSEMVTRRTVKECESSLREKDAECMQALHDQQLKYERELAQLRSELNVARAQLEMMKNGVKETDSTTPSKLYSMAVDDVHLQAAEPEGEQLT